MNSFTYVFIMISANLTVESLLHASHHQLPIQRKNMRILKQREKKLCKKEKCMKRQDV